LVARQQSKKLTNNKKTILTIDGSDCNFIDHDILEIISDYKNKAKDRHIELHLVGIEGVKTMKMSE
jgi:MFS superfamily sulfate permease-like transporter